jgi:transposase
MSKTGNQREVQASHAASSGAGHPPPRREYTRELKLRVVKESFVPGSSASIAARHHNINANVVFRWRREYREGYLTDRVVPSDSGLPESRFMPVGIVDDHGSLRALPAPQQKQNAILPSRALAEPGFIEIEAGSGVKVRVTGSVDDRVLSLVLAEIRRRP